jgi:hypothetical protein
MGLDAVELVIRTENEFGITISDADATRITTPRELACFVSSRIRVAPVATCLTQQAFNRLRAALVAAGIDRATVRPSTSLDVLFPAADRRARWKSLGRRVAASRWPRLVRPILHPTQAIFPRGCDTVGKLARHVATWDERIPQGTAAAWTKETVLLRVRQITTEELGIDTFHDDDHYIRDLHVD